MDSIYVLDFGDKVKIGFSNDVNRRIRQIETGSANEVRQKFTLQGTKQKELVIHQKLKSRQIIGEYYSIPFEDAVRAVIDTPEPPKSERDKSGIVFRAKELLALQGMTQKELAEKTGVRPPTISAICTGQAKHIPVDVLCKLCAVLECQPGDLMEYIPDAESCTPKE